MRIKPAIALDFKDVLIVPKRSSISSRSEVDLVREFTFKHAKCSWFGIPIVSANMDTVTNLRVADIMRENNMLAACQKGFWLGADGSIPTFGLEFTKFFDLTPILDYQGFILLDTANGQMQRFVHFVELVRSKCPKTIIIAGNTVTPEMTEALILAGADIVKVGLGSGAVCETRKITGIGVPQLTAVMECADAAHGLGAYIMSDGGCREPGDVCKAFAAGSDFIMLGFMLANHEENGKIYYGLSSKLANEKFAGGLKEYRAAEGKVMEFSESRGPLKNTLQQITGGLRSCCSYVGASRLKDLPKCSTFIQVIP